QVDVDIPPKPAALPDTLKYCVGDSGEIVLEDYSFAYFWKNEAGDIVAENGPLNIPTTDAGNFAYYFEAYNGCGSFRDTVTVFVVEEGAIVIQPDETIVVCNNDPLTLTVNAPLADCVVWLDENSTAIDTGAQVTVIPQPGNNIYVATLPGLACVTADTAEVVFIPDDFEVQVTASAAEVCLGTTVSLTAAILPPNNVTVVTWYDSGFNFLGEGLSIEATPTVSGIQTYIAVAENGCTVDTAMLDILVEELMLDLSVSAETICNGEEVTLSVSGCDDCTYSWSPEGALSAPDMATTQAFPDVTTTYEVIVAGAVCTDTLSTVVTVEECLDCNVDLIFIADAFTPDGDGNNDLVCVRSEVLNQFESVELMIYNRWGQEVYQSEEMSSLCWDGTFAGEALPPDVYGYVLRIVCPPTDTQPRTENVLKGNITLLR
ncbi:T9SS type B sorting domain-containing protein, partial [Phaeodactylibacter luteus]